MERRLTGLDDYRGAGGGREGSLRSMEMKLVVKRCAILGL